MSNPCLHDPGLCSGWCMGCVATGQASHQNVVGALNPLLTRLVDDVLGNLLTILCLRLLPVHRSMHWWRVPFGEWLGTGTRECQIGMALPTEFVSWNFLSPLLTLR